MHRRVKKAAYLYSAMARELRASRISGFFLLITRRLISVLSDVYTPCRRQIRQIDRSLAVRFKSYRSARNLVRKRPRASKFCATLAILAISFGLMNLVGASDEIRLWDFSNTSEYTLSDSSKIEFTSGAVRLKAQNYPTDVNTSALYHFDENTGAIAADSSANNNNLALTNSTWASGELNTALSFNGTTSSASVPDSPSLSLTQSNTLEAWTKLGSSFSSGSQSSDQPVIDKGSYKLYYDHETGKPTYELENSSATTWTQAAGNDVNGSWDINGKAQASSSVVFGGNLYVGTGPNVGDAEVWKYNGTTWSQIGGDGLNASWPNFTYEDVPSLTTDGTNLYAGTGVNSGDAEVWKYNGSTWAKIGGDTVNSSWALTTYDYVHSLSFFGGNLYAGLGFSTGEAEVWRWNGTSWTQIGGDNLNGGWTGSQQVRTLQNDGTNLYASVSIVGTAGGADLWRWNGTSWAQIGGDGINSSWAASTYEEVLSSFFQAGNLYVGLGTNAGDAEVWRWNGSAWSRIGFSGSPFTAATYEGVYSISGDGTNIYAGIGLSQNDGDVWRWNGTTWAQIGGDNLNGGWTQGYIINTMAWYDSKLFADATQASTGDVMFSWNGTAWSRQAGQFFNGSWGYSNMSAVRTMTTASGKLYAGLQASGAGGATVFEYNGSSWQLIGAPGLNSAWGAGTHTGVFSMTSSGSDLYVGLTGSGNTDGEVWKYNGTTWTQVGGDGLNSGWNSGVTTIPSLTFNQGILYAGIGSTGGNGDVWKFENGTWARIGGGGLSGGWNNSYRTIASMAIYQGNLVIGAYGSLLNSADLWRWNGTTWTQIGGDGLNSGWNFTSTNNAEVSGLVENQGKLYAAVSSFTVGDAEVWEYNGSVWSKIGGDDISGSWSSSAYDRVSSIASYNGEIYAGLGTVAGNGEVWKYRDGSWSQSAGDSINSSWTNAVETTRALQVYKGKLYAGLGDSQNADAMIYSYGNNGYLQGSTSSFDTNWHHLAATYDGSSMKIFVDGALDGTASTALSMPDKSQSLLIGQSYGADGAGSTQSRLNGSLDEVRISNVARTSFITKPYVTERVAVSLAEAQYKTGIASWDGFSATESADGGQIAYRISIDEGSSWKYWNGSDWTNSTGLSEANAASEINAEISSLAVTTGGIMWQAILSGNGEQRPAVNSVQLEATKDETAPAANASSIVMKTGPIGATIDSGDWLNDASPYFSWSPANDSQSDIMGYCLYLGTDNTADPEQSKGSLLGSSPVSAADICPYMVASSELDTETVGVLVSALSSSNSSYYLKIKAVDNASNVFIGSSASFDFRFDNTAPSNPLFVSTPSQFVSNKQVTVTWPVADGNAAQDSHSGVAGLQYKISSNGTWYGDAHTASEDSSDLLVNDGVYQTIDPEDFDELVDGTNTIYFRTYDEAGNVSATFVTGVIKINTVSPTTPLNVTATPATNTSNSFAFSWDPPANLGVPANSLQYCYTINTLPSASTCNFTAQNITSLPAGAYATQPGENTFYVVAKDEAGNINYVTYGQATFTANTSAPGIPRNIDIADISVKSTSNWRLALSWDAPSDVGAGVSSYKIYRSINNISFSQIASTSGTSYVDGGLQEVAYYYKVQACDSANNCGVQTQSATETPTGKYITPAELVSAPRVTEISTRKGTVNWSTDRNSDSRIQYGLSSGNYFSTEAAISTQTTDHAVELNNLTAGTTYFYRARWTDADGNIGTSSEYSFTTSPAPVVKEATAKTSLTSAVVTFTSKDAAKVKVYYGRSEGFGGVTELNTSLSESTYSLDLAELEDGAKYFYKINTFDSDNNEYEGNVYAFSTPPRPRISNVRFQPVENQPSSTQRVSWNTNVPSTSEVSYGVGNLGKSVNDPKVTTQHEITISGLSDDSSYQLVARSRDENGNLAQSDVQVFRTALDTRPPQISEVQVDVSIRGTGSEARGQIVVSWKTDEPSTSQVAYGEGSAGSLSSTTSEDTELTTDHVMVISDLSTSRVYQIEPRSFDRARNVSTGDKQIAIVGRASENVLSIIFNALRNIFGVEG